MGMKRFMGKYPTLSSMPLPYPTLPAGIGLFMGKYPTLSPLGPTLPYPTLPYPRGLAFLWASILPCRLCPYPTLPYPRGLGALWASALPCRLCPLPYPTLDMETVHAHGDSFGHPRGLGALWAGRTPSRLCPLTHGDSSLPMETVHRPVTGMKRFMGKCPTLSPLPLNHGDSFTGRSTFIHVIPYTFICNRIPSNILQ